MCGIVGIHHYSNHSVPLTDNLLGRMCERIRHRGPDDSGAWINEDRNVGLGFRRLSIIDLSRAANQPMTNEDGSLWIVFNGEIYNYRELRPWLEEHGHVFRSRSDTEVILHLYEELGASCVGRLDGMFAFAIWDSNQRSWFLARDRLGVKPLYYFLQQGIFLFASEIKALLVHPAVGHDLEPDALDQLLAFKTTLPPLTLFKGIKKLGSSTMMHVDAGGNAVTTLYWDAVSPDHPPLEHCSEEEATQTVRQLLEEAVRKRMVADVPVGAFLSGGLDSSCVVSLMAKHASQPIRTFCVGIIDAAQGNEFRFARQVAERYGTDHSEIEISHKDVAAYIPSLVQELDEPLAETSGVSLHFVAKLARDSGVPVVLTGEGSDELFFGYDFRLELLRHFRKRWAPLLALPGPALRGALAATRWSRRTFGIGANPERILSQAAQGQGHVLAHLTQSLNFFAPLLREPVNRTVPQAAVEAIWGRMMKSWPHADVASQISYQDLVLLLAEFLLLRLDRLTMAVGLEAREPFMDFRLIEYAIRLPAHLKIKKGSVKHILKQATRDLVPPEILQRRKQVFPAPVNLWLRSGLMNYARPAILESSLRKRDLFRYAEIENILNAHESGSSDHSQAIWSILVLSAWYDCWIGRS